MGEQTKALILLLILVSLAVSITEVKVAKADSSTLVVPDDYPTIAAAIGNATDGDTVFVKTGTYDGPMDQALVINKSISLVGEDSETTILNMHPNYISRYDPFNWPFRDYDYSIKILADDVELSGFTINSIMVKEVGYGSLGFTSDSPTTQFFAGGLLADGNNTQVIHNVLNIKVFSRGSYGNIVHNSLTHGIYGVRSRATISKNKIQSFLLVGGGAGGYTVHDNIVINGSGITVAGAGARIFNNTISNCSRGVRVVSYAHDNFVYENVVTNNDIGLCVDTYGENNVFYSNYVANNEIGITSGLQDYIRGPYMVYNNSFVDNTQQVEILDDFEGDQWDNGTFGNYWSGYTGVDADGDGIGDTPYIIDENNQDNYPLMQPVTIPILQPLEICILSPQNITYSTDSVSLNFVVNKKILWMGYSLDKQTQVTATENSLNLTGLTNGIHILTVYADDTAGNMGNSETICFTIAKEAEPEPEPEPNPTSWTVTATAIAAVAIVGAAAIVVYKKTRKANKKQDILEA